MKPDWNINGPWEQHGYSDADYAGDNDTGENLTGYIVIINRVVIAWRSWIQKAVTLSVIEAEYSAITEVCYEILFMCAILLFMGVVDEYPIMVLIDNVGAVLISEKR